MQTVPSGTLLLSQGAQSEVVYALTAGRVRVVYAEENGDETLIAIRGPGDLLGEYAQRDRREHMASVWTLEECAVAALTADAFEGCIVRNGLGEPLQHYMLGKARQIGARMWRASNLQIEQRMAQLFLEVLEAAPEATPAAVPMSQTLIADSLGVTRRSVNLLLSQWKRQRLVRTSPAPLAVLDLPALARRANPH